MSSGAIETGEPAIPALTRLVVDARDPRIMGVMALIDANMQRGPADVPIEQLRQCLATFRPPPPLYFGRLVFAPLDLLIVPSARWRPPLRAIPHEALAPMASQIHSALGEVAIEIEAEIAGHTMADVELISRLGQSLWPEAARILADTAIPATWDATELGDMNHRPLANAIATLLAEAAPVDRLVADAATGLLPPRREAIDAILGRVGRANQAALPMMIAVLLDRLPEVAELLPTARSGSEAAATYAAIHAAADLLLQQLQQEDSIEKRIAGRLADAGATVGRIAALLKYLDTAMAKPQRRERLRAMRRRLEADCQARFALGLREELLAPLLHVGVRPGPGQIPGLESVARGLRVLETEGRILGGGSIYDLLLRKAAEAIKDSEMQDRLSQADQLRLVEILVGPDAALAMLDRPL